MMLKSNADIAKMVSRLATRGIANKRVIANYRPSRDGSSEQHRDFSTRLVPMKGKAFSGSLEVQIQPLQKMMP